MNSELLSIFKNINISSIASTANKTLSVIKKTIPVYKEVKPYILREKSIFKKKEEPLVDEIKESNVSLEDRSSSYNDTLTFFQ